MYFVLIPNSLESEVNFSFSDRHTKWSLRTVDFSKLESLKWRYVGFR